ncbi:MAG: NUDIX domain-containing protein [Chloroflexota bacterium]|nr:NUDIX domain-containing protein [Chloroflexota bacterium]
MTLQPDFAQDPEERFDIVTSDGRPTGQTKARRDVHRDGDWHRSIHVWVYGIAAAQPFILMNQRGLDKDTWPGVLDATVGGHLSAGETVGDAYREIEEEIGITADPARMQWVGTRLCSAESVPGIIDRELQEVFLYRDDRQLAEYRPNPAELEGLIQVSLADALTLFAGEVSEVPGTILHSRARTAEPFTISQENLLPVRIDRYFLRVAVAILRTLRHDRYVVL